MARLMLATLLVALAAAGCSSSAASGDSTAASTTPTTSSSAPSSPAESSSPPGPRWKHVVVVVEENHGAGSILGSADAPYFNELARAGLNLTDMRAETHPSQPNYLALFSGSMQGVRNDSCPHTFAADNLGHQLRAAGYSFTGYSEHLPRAGYSGCDSYPYVRRHVPWTDFADLPDSVNQPMSAMPSDYSALPTVAFVIPDLLDDMHDGTIARADAWLHQHMSDYAAWARTHDSLLIVTWDENEGAPGNRIATFAVGDNVGPGTWSARANHYSLLRTLEAVYGLPALGKAAAAEPITPLR